LSGLLPDQRTVRISHSSGAIEVGVMATSTEAFAVVNRCVVSRTARRLFEGRVWYYPNEI
jgi:2-methylaconitate cis-trans-isomerase PrpF